MRTQQRLLSTTIMALTTLLPTSYGFAPPLFVSFNLDDLLKDAQDAVDGADEALQQSPSRKLSRREKRRLERNPPRPPDNLPPVPEAGFLESISDSIVEGIKAAPGKLADAAANKAKETGDWVVDEIKATPGRMADAAANKAKETGEWVVDEIKQTPGRMADAAVNKAKETGEWVVDEVKQAPGRAADAAKRKAKETVDEIAAQPQKIANDLQQKVNELTKKKP